MKKLLFCLLCFCLMTFGSSAKIIEVAPAGAWGTMIIGGGSGGEAPAGGTDFTADANCQGAWFMNGAEGGDGSEAEADRSGETENLTAGGGATIVDSSDQPSGYTGRSRVFAAGDSEWLYHADGGSTEINGLGGTGTGDITLAAWIKMSADTALDQHVISKYLTTDSQRQYWLGIDDGEDLSITSTLSSDGTAQAVVLGVTDLDVAVWYHIALVYNDTDMRIYINGVLDSNGANNPATYSAGIADKSSEFRIGARGNGDNFFSGNIDEVIVFNRALSAAEILGLKTYGIDGSKGGND